MSWDTLIPLIAILPLAGFAFTALVGRRLGKGAHWVPVGAVFVAWLIDMAAAFGALTGAEPFGEYGYGVVEAFGESACALYQLGTSVAGCAHRIFLRNLRACRAGRSRFLGSNVKLSVPAP